MILEKEEETEGKTWMWEKNGSVAFCTHPNEGSNPKPRYVPWLGIESAASWCTGEHSNQLSRQARTDTLSFIHNVKIKRGHGPKFKIIKLLDKNTDHLCNLELGKDFLEMISKT